MSEKRIDWNKWREDYDKMSFADQQKFYQECPICRFCGSEEFVKRIDSYCKTHSNIRILEVGGSNGVLATKLLPMNPNIICWGNIDIDPKAGQRIIFEKVGNGWVSDLRYQVRILQDYIWNEPPAEGFDVVILCHILEHLKAKDVLKLMDYLQNIPVVFMEVPLPFVVPDWTNYEGTHILEWSFDQLLENMNRIGYNPTDVDIRGLVTLNKSIIYDHQQKQTILLVGWMRADRHGAGFVKALEQCGHRVIKVSTDIEPEDNHIPHDLGVRDFPDAKSIQDGDIRFDISRIFDHPKYTSKYKNVKIDWIYLIQSNKVLFDMSNIIDIPWIYWFKEMCWLTWPVYNIRNPCLGVFHAFVGSKEQLQTAYRPELKLCKFVEFMSYAVDPEVFYPDTKKDRVYYVGFKGSQGTLSPDEKVPFFSDIYKNRDRYLNYLRKNVKTYHEQKKDWGKGYQTYLDFLQHTNLAINIPGNWGFINDRQMQAPASGCVLLQWHYSELADLHFKNKENCLTFSNELEMLEQIVWAKDHPKELENIRQKGLELIKSEHTYLLRTKKLLQTLYPFLQLIWARKEWAEQYLAKRGMK